MFTVVISEKGGPQQRLEFDQNEVSIGRIQGNDVMLPKGNVSKRHARIIVKDAKYIIVDLNSTNGTYVNGRKIQSPQVVKSADKVYIGDFILALDGLGEPEEVIVDAPPAPAPEPPALAETRPPAPAGRQGAPQATMRQPPMPTSAPAPPRSQDPPDNGFGRPRAEPAPDPPAPRVDTPPFAPAPPRPAEEPVAPAPPAPEAPRPSADERDRPYGGKDPFGAPAPAPEPPRQMPDLRAPEPPAVAPEPPAAPEPTPAPAYERKARADARGPAPVPPIAAEPAPARLPALPQPPPRGDTLSPEAPRREDEEGPTAELRARQAALARLVEMVRPTLEELAAGERLSWEAYRERVEDALDRLVPELEPSRLPPGVGRDLLQQDALNEATGYGPLEDLLADESVREIQVNGALHIYTTRGGETERERRVFSGEEAVYSVILRLIQGTGARLSADSPAVDVRRPDGVRVTALIPPVAVRGPVLTVRRSRVEPLDIDDLILNETLSAEMAEFLEACVRARKNVLVAGAARSGKTSLLNSLAMAIPEQERILVIEGSVELSLPQENVVTLEARAAAPGQLGVCAGDLVRIGRRLRSDRVIVGDVDSDGALELLRGMSSGSEGVLACVHAVDAQSAVERLEALCLIGAPEMPARIVRELLANGVDLILVLTRFSSGERKVTSVVEVAGLDVDLVNLAEIFYFEKSGTDRDGVVQGRFRPTGFVPRFFEDLQRRGLAPARNLFR